jgi:DNA-binding transcriptional LysR family regulator
VCVSDGLALRAAVAAGAGIGMVPDHAAEGQPELTPVLQGFETPSLDCYSFIRGDEVRRKDAGVPGLSRAEGPALELLSKFSMRWSAQQAGRPPARVL